MCFTRKPKLQKRKILSTKRSHVKGEIHVKRGVEEVSNKLFNRDTL